MRLLRFSLFLALLLLCIVHASEPVDKFQFWQIRPGMSETDVVLSLGQPAKITEAAESSEIVHTIKGTELRPRRRYTYIYSGNSQGMDTYITFENGVVVDKVRVPR